MKKKVLMLFLTVVLLCSVVAFSASAEELPAVCPHCNKAVTWTALDEAAAQQTTLAEGHYYLAFSESAAT